MSDINIRVAEESDSAIILGFITELAIYENAEVEVVATIDDIQESIFGDTSTVKALICSRGDEPVGFAVYFFNYSTWLGRKGLYLEDLYVSPNHRGSGAGKALLVHLAKIAFSENCGRFEWSVLDWNEPAIQFYRGLGALPQDGWINYHLDRKGIETLANN